VGYRRGRARNLELRWRPVSNGTVSAGHGEYGTANEHLRALDPTGIDGVPQGNVGVVGTCGVTHGRKPGHQGSLRVHHSEDPTHRRRNLAVGKIRIVAQGEMSVNIDQSWEDVESSKINRIGIRIICRCSAAYFDDAPFPDDDHRILLRRAAGRVD